MVKASQPVSSRSTASQPAAACSQPASEPASSSSSSKAAASQPVGQQPAGQPATSSTSSEPASQPASSRASQLVNSVVLRGVALLYESSGGNQVDGLPPVPTYAGKQYRCRISRRFRMTRLIITD